MKFLKTDHCLLNPVDIHVQKCTQLTEIRFQRILGRLCIQRQIQSQTIPADHRLIQKTQRHKAVLADRRITLHTVEIIDVQFHVSPSAVSSAMTPGPDPDP